MVEYFLTAKQAAERFGLSLRSLTALLYQKKVPGKKIDKRWYISSKDFDKIRNREDGRKGNAANFAKVAEN